MKINCKRSNINKLEHTILYLQNIKNAFLLRKIVLLMELCVPTSQDLVQVSN